MRHHIFEEASSYNVAVLIKSTSFNKQELLNNYVNPLVAQGIPMDSMIAFTLQYNPSGKASVKEIKQYLTNLLPALDSLSVKYLYVADSNYFKVLAGQTKAEPHYGYVLPCKIKGYEHMQVVLGMNYQALIYNPDLQAKLTLSLNTLASSIQGTYSALGSGIIHSAEYPETTESIAAALEKLHQYPSLSCDIEAFSLRFNKAGIGTIAFAWDKHNGVAFPVDYKPILCQADIDAAPMEAKELHGYYLPNPEVKRLLKKFFTEYKGKITWHNGVFDIKIIIYELWMKPV